MVVMCRKVHRRAALFPRCRWIIRRNLNCCSHNNDGFTLCVKTLQLSDPLDINLARSVYHYAQSYLARMATRIIQSIPPGLTIDINTACGAFLAIVFCLVMVYRSCSSSNQQRLTVSRVGKDPIR